MAVTLQAESIWALMAVGWVYATMLLAPAAVAVEASKVLMVVSNVLDMGDPDKHAVVVDDRIVSTMFLPSAALVAEEMVRLLQSENP